MKLAKLVRQDLASPVQVGIPMLTGPVTASSSFSDSSFTWSGTIIRKFNTMSGTGLIERFQGPYCTGELLGDGFLLSDGVIINRGVLFSGGQPIMNGDAVWTQNSFVADGVMVSDDILM